MAEGVLIRELPAGSVQVRVVSKLYVRAESKIAAIVLGHAVLDL